VTLTILTDQQPVTNMYSPRLICDGIAQSVYGLDDPGIESRWVGRGEIFHNRPGRPWGPPSFLSNGYRVSPGRGGGGGKGAGGGGGEE